MILVLGGSNFAGRAAVAALTAAGFDVTMANRGKSHWNDSNPLQVKRSHRRFKLSEVLQIRS